MMVAHICEYNKTTLYFHRPEKYLQYIYITKDLFSGNIKKKNKVAILFDEYANNSTKLW